MEDALSVDVVDGLQELVHVGLDFVDMQIFVPDQAFVEVLFHEFEDEG